MNDIKCPYCGHAFDLDYSEGKGCREDVTEQEICPNCEKEFVFTTAISYHHTARKADCVNGGEHDWRASISYPKRYTKMRCLMCDEERRPTAGELAEILKD